MQGPPRAAVTVLGLGALASLTRSHVLRHVDVLAHPKGEAADQRPRLDPPEVSAQRAMVELAQHLCTQPAAGGARGCRADQPDPVRGCAGAPPQSAQIAEWRKEVAKSSTSDKTGVRFPLRLGASSQP